MTDHRTTDTPLDTIRDAACAVLRFDWERARRRALEVDDTALAAIYARTATGFRTMAFRIEDGLPVSQIPRSVIARIE